jgi:hypothetical protein
VHEQLSKLTGEKVIIPKKKKPEPAKKNKKEHTKPKPAHKQKKQDTQKPTTVTTKVEKPAKKQSASKRSAKSK